MMARMTIFLVLALAVYVFMIQRQLTAFRLRTNERLHALETKQAEHVQAQDRMAADWSQLFANVNEQWDKHIERVADQVASKLALQKHQPKVRR